MATSDLTNELLSPQMESVLNDAFSYKVVDAVLNSLRDKNGEVQNMGVKWSLVSYGDGALTASLSALVPKLKTEHVQIIIDRLSRSTDASNQNAELRDISSTGIYVPNQRLLMTALRTVIAEIPSNSSSSHVLIQQLMPRLQEQVPPMILQI